MNWMRWEHSWMNMVSFHCLFVTLSEDGEGFQIRGAYKNSEYPHKENEPLFDCILSDSHKTFKEAQSYLDSRMRDFYGLPKQ